MPAELGTATTRNRWALAAIVVVAIAALANALKGVQLSVSHMMWPYWTLSYRHGFIRRGLAGTIFQAVAVGLRDDEQRSLALDLHIVAWVAMAGVIVCEAVDAARGGNTRSRRIVFLGVTAVLASQLVPTLGAIAGYLDVYIVLIALITARFARQHRWMLAGLLGAIGPLVHDGFLFLWLPIVALAAYDVRRSEWRVRSALPGIAWLMVPLASEALVFAFHSSTALSRCFLELPAGAPDIRVFELPLGFLLHRMFDTYEHHLPNFVLAVIFYGAPAVVTILCAERLVPHASRFARLALPYVALLPCSILLVAWDLSRFLVWMHVGAFVVLCHAAPREPVEESSSDAARVPPAISLGLAALVVFAVGGPSVFSYFDHTFVEYRVGPRVLTHTPGAALSIAFANLFNRHAQRTALSSAQGCPLDLPAPASDAPCRPEVTATSFVHTPPLSLAPGRYSARVDVEPLACEEAAGVVVVRYLSRLAMPDPPPVAFDARVATSTIIDFEVDAQAAATARMRVAIEGRAGCFRVAALEIASRGRP